MVARQHRRGTQHLGHRYDASAADPGDAQGEVLFGNGQLWFRQVGGRRRHRVGHTRRCRQAGRSGGAVGGPGGAEAAQETTSRPAGPAQPAPPLRPISHPHGHERRTIAFQAGVIEVAGGLVDLGLGSKAGAHRLHRQAVAHPATVPAALAQPLVDDHPMRRYRRPAPLTIPPGLGGASLIVDEYAHPCYLSQAFLGLDQTGSWPHRHPGRQRHPPIPIGIFGGDEDLGHPHVHQQGAHRGHISPAHRILAAGHGHRAVEQQLVGDVDLGRHRRADRQLPGMEKRAVAQVLDEVVALQERAHADPLGALVAHAGDGRDVSHPLWIH